MAGVLLALRLEGWAAGGALVARLLGVLGKDGYSARMKSADFGSFGAVFGSGMSVAGENLLAWIGTDLLQGTLPPVRAEAVV